MKAPTAKAKSLPKKVIDEGRSANRAPPQRKPPSTKSKVSTPKSRSPNNSLPGQPDSPKGSKVSAEVPKIKGELRGLQQKTSSQAQNNKGQLAGQLDSKRPVDPPDTERSHGLVSTPSESSMHSLRPVRAASEPPFPRTLGHLGIPTKSPRSSPMPQGREAANSSVFEWEQAQSRRAALYSEIPDRGRSYQDSSAVNALVFGKRTRPGSVDPGPEDRIRPGSIMELLPAGMPASAGFREGLRRQAAVALQPSNGVLMGEPTMGRSCSEKPLNHRRRSVPQMSGFDEGNLKDVVFGSSTTRSPPHPEVLRQVWGGCAGQPSTRVEGGRKAPQFETVLDQGYAGLVSSSCTLTSSLPGSPISPFSDTSSVAESTRRSGIRLIGAPESNYQIQEASPHWQLEKKGEEDERLSTYRHLARMEPSDGRLCSPFPPGSLHAGAAGRSSWMGSVSRRQHLCETGSRGKTSDQSSDMQASSPQGSGTDRSMRRQFPSKPTTQASLISLAHDAETGRKIREEAEAWNKLFEKSAGRLTHREERRGVKSVTSSVPSTKDLLTPSPEPLPSPRLRATPEQGGGAPWERLDSVLNATGAQVKDSSSV